MMLVLNVPRWRGLGGGSCYAAVMLYGYHLEVLFPPPSLRDTSARGGHRMTSFAIAAQSLRGNDRLGTFLESLLIKENYELRRLCRLS